MTPPLPVLNLISGRQLLVGLERLRPHLRVKKTSISGDWMSACSHKRTLALPQEVEHWSLTTLREKLIKIGAKVVRHGRYVTFQLAEVAISRALFAEILRLIDRLRPAPLPP